jgi:DNA-binding Xre family transcriptional regulator
MERKRITMATKRTPDELAELRAERERFGQARPGLDDLIDSGEVDPADVSTMGNYLDLLDVVTALRHERERLGLSLTDVAARSGIERSAISKLETGKVMNPTVSTLQRYAEALHQRITWNLRPVETAPS